jgi:hypothetical protein
VYNKFAALMVEDEEEGNAATTESRGPEAAANAAMEDAAGVVA